LGGEGGHIKKRDMKQPFGRGKKSSSPAKRREKGKAEKNHLTSSGRMIWGGPAKGPFLVDTTTEGG